MRKYLLATALLVAFSAAVLAEDIPTRYGPIRIGGDLQSDLFYKGRKILRGGNPLSLARRFRMGRTDVLLIEETGGTGCPELYYFVSVSASGARTTRAFGTCDEFTSITQKGRAIQVTMRGFRGPFEPAADREKALKERHVFLFRNGVVTEKGKPVR